MRHTEKVTDGAAVLQAGAKSLYIDLALMAGFGVLLAVLKIFDKTNMHLPGVTGIYWVSVLLISRGSTGRSWGGAFTGGAASVASLALAPVAALAATGITIKFVVTGVVIDLLAPVFDRLKGLPMMAAWIFMGASANGMKFVAHVIFKTATAQFSNSIMRGFGPSMAYHLLFGAIGGLVAYGLYTAAMKRKTEKV